MKSKLSFQIRRVRNTQLSVLTPSVTLCPILRSSETFFEETLSCQDDLGWFWKAEELSEQKGVPASTTEGGKKQRQCHIGTDLLHFLVSREVVRNARRDLQRHGHWGKSLGTRWQNFVTIIKRRHFLIYRQKRKRFNQGKS